MNIWRYEIISRSLVRFAHSWDILVNTRNKFHISAQPCITLYLYIIGIIINTIALKVCALLHSLSHNFLYKHAIVQRKHIYLQSFIIRIDTSPMLHICDPPCDPCNFSLNSRVITCIAGWMFWTLLHQTNLVSSFSSSPRLGSGSWRQYCRVTTSRIWNITLTKVILRQNIGCPLSVTDHKRLLIIHGNFQEV